MGWILFILSIGLLADFMVGVLLIVALAFFFFSLWGFYGHISAVYHVNISLDCSVRQGHYLVQRHYYLVSIFRFTFM